MSTGSRQININLQMSGLGQGVSGVKIRNGGVGRGRDKASARKQTKSKEYIILTRPNLLQCLSSYYSYLCKIFR